MTPIRTPRNRLPELMGAGPFERLMVITECIYAMHRSLVKGRHCYLLFLGVEPGQQQQGIGSLLIKPVLKRADEEGLPCYLETMKEVNLAFYGKHGFRVGGRKTNCQWWAAHMGAAKVAGGIAISAILFYEKRSGIVQE